MNYIILHGTLGNPDGNWFPWLASELQQHGHRVILPQLPTPEGQSPENWKTVIRESVNALGGPDLQTVIVAHSMSCLSACQYISELRSPIGAGFFVAGFAKKLIGIPDPYPALNDPFSEYPIDWKRVRKNITHICCIASENDPYVSLPISHDFAAKLGVLCTVLPEAGHFTTASGFTEFPLLLQKITMQ